MFTHRKKLYLVLLSVVMASCSSAPDVNEVLHDGLIIPENWHTQDATEESSVLINLPHSLVENIKLAGLNNLDIKMAYQRLKISEAALSTSESKFWPQVNASLSGRRGQSQVVEKNWTTSYSSGFRVSWELDIWDKLDNLEKAAISDLDAVKFDLEAASKLVTSQIILTYFDIQQASELIEIAKSNLESQTKRVEITEQRLDSGLVDSQDYRLAMNSLKNIESNLIQQQLNLHQSIQKFNLLLGQNSDSLTITPDLNIDIPEQIQVISPKQVLSKRPDLVAAEYRLTSAFYRKKEADKGYLPDIKLTGNLQVNNRVELSQLFDWQYWLSSLTADITQPIFNAGAIKAEQESRTARQELALVQYKKELLVAWQEIERSLYLEKMLRDKLKTTQDGYTHIKAAEARIIEKYQDGVATSFELLNLQSRRINAQSELTRTRYSILASRVRLILALGESFNINETTEIL